MEFTPEQFNKVKNAAEIFYQEIQKVHCPSIKGEVRRWREVLSKYHSIWDHQ